MSLLGGTMLRRTITPEERVAQKLSAIVSDLRLDIEQVGVYLARTSPYVSYNRLIEIAESAQFEKEQNELRFYQHRLF